MNETARWIEANWTELDDKLQSTFMSYFSGTNVRLDIEDWVQEFVAHLIEKDPIPAYLAKGAPTKAGQNLIRVVSFWGFRYVCSHIKRQAMDTVGRLYTGSQTELELNQKLPPSQLAPFEELECHKYCGSLPDQKVQLRDLVTTAGWWVNMCFPRAHERYMSMLQHLVLGCTISDIAKAENISRHRAAGLVDEMRQRLRRAADTPENFSEIEYVRVA